MADTTTSSCAAARSATFTIRSCFHGACTGWHIANNDILGDTEKGISGEGVELNHSSDHTVCYNRIGRSADGISYPHTNCDMFGNDIFDMSDDPIEPDYGYANIRIWGNRLHGHTGITFQPMYCGPWYLIRNHAISKGNVFKLRVQDRFVVVNNTFAAWTTPVPHAHGLLTALLPQQHLDASRRLGVSLGVQRPGQREGPQLQHQVCALRFARRELEDGCRLRWLRVQRRQPASEAQNQQNPWMLHNQRFFDLPSLAAAIGIEAHGRVLDRTKDFEPSP